MKYGIMYYKETDNIGDDIQTYTALRFLPHIDYYIDREDLNCFIPKEKEYVSMIMNGWYIHNKAAWPPSPYINPLLMSMHFTCLEKIDVGEKYLQGLGGEYLKKYEPIGCRDVETQKRLSNNGIENYFSGCMTLTIEKFEDVKKEDYICLVDLDKNSADLVKQNTNREIKEITHWLDPKETVKKTFEERMNEVEKILKTYQGAHVVFTNRLHVALPCIALGTPVVLIHKEKYEEDRLGTFLKYMTSYTDVEFAKLNINEIIENPKDNNEEYLQIRNDLEKRCKEFIKKSEEKTDIENLPDVEEYKKYVDKISWYKDLYEDVRVKAKNNLYESDKKYQEYIAENSKIWEEKQKCQEELEEYKKKYNELDDKYKILENQKEQIEYEKEKLKQEIDNIYNSKSWKYLNKMRNIKNKIKPNNKGE